MGGQASRPDAKSRAFAHPRAKENPPMNKTAKDTFALTALLLAPLVALCAADTPKPPAKTHRPHFRRR
jgi:hypothetical protein